MRKRQSNNVHTSFLKFLLEKKSNEQDEEKRKVCKEKNITLIEIPYWWDKQLSSLISTIHQQRKDLIPICDEKPISNQYFEINSIRNDNIELMHGEDWSGDEDIRGW